MPIIYKVNKPRFRLEGAGAVLGKESLADFLTIRIAGNEQKPLSFHSDYVKEGRGVIHTFDYALEGDQDNFAVEWKEKDDFISSLVIHKKWVHELAKIARAKEWGLPKIYVVGMNFEDVVHYDYSIFSSGNVTSQFVFRQIATMIYDYGVMVCFANNREMGAYAMALILKRRQEHLRKEAKCLKQDIK